MLATVRIGAIHSVVFAGFGAKALSDRIAASGSRLVFTADATYRKGKDVPLKEIVDDALVTGGATVEHVVVLDRTSEPAPKQARDISWDDFLARGNGQLGDWVAMEANEPAFILATSGTTAKPKLAVHTHGGYQVHIHSMGRWCSGLRPTDVWWSTSDIGWIVGHSYIVYAPLLAGCTTVAFEGALDYPQADSNWRTVVEELGCTGIFTSPTAVRVLMRYGDEPLTGIDHSRLERVFCAGEVLNPPAWEWLQNKVFGDRIPVIDHMWQTETGGPVFGNPYGIGLLPIKPGSAGIPLPGIEAAVVNLEGEPCAAGREGDHGAQAPVPGPDADALGRARALRATTTGGASAASTTPATRRTSTRTATSGSRAAPTRSSRSPATGSARSRSRRAFLSHPGGRRGGVTGRPDELRGEVISAFVVLKHGHTASEELRKALIETVRRELGPVAVIGELNFVSMLPKTRSGKIMRRVLKAVTLDRDPGDITTIEDEGSVEEARQAWQQMRDEIRPLRK